MFLHMLIRPLPRAHNQQHNKRSHCRDFPNLSQLVSFCNFNSKKTTTSSYSRAGNKTRARKINACYLQFHEAVVVLRHTVTECIQSPFLLNVVVDSFLRNPKLIKSIYHNYGQPQHLQPHTDLTFLLSSKPTDEEQRSACDNGNLKSLVCDLLLGIYYIRSLRVLCVYELIRRIN